MYWCWWWILLILQLDLTKSLAGFIENWGRGYVKIKNAFEQENLQIPTFEQVRGGVLATIQREKFVALNKQNVGNDVGDVSVIDRLMTK